MTNPEDSNPSESVPPYPAGNGAAMPSYPAGSGAPVPPPAAPSTAPRPVVLGFWLYIAAAALSIISMIIALATINNSRASIQTQLAAQGQTVSDSTISAVIGLTIGISVVFAVIWVVLFVLFAFLMKRGAGWARIVLTIVTVLSLVNTLSGVGVGAIQVIAAIVATVLIWLRPASAYFAAVKASKQRTF